MISIFITSLFWACDNSVPIPPKPQIPQVVEQETIFEMVWATRMDIENEILNQANGVSYKDLYIRTGDLDFPANIRTFNKLTGDKDWEYIYDGDDNSNVDRTHLFRNILICVTAKRVFGFNLDTKTVAWEVNLGAMNIRPARGTIASNNRFYLDADYDFKHDEHTQHLMEFNVSNGDYRIVYSVSKDDFGYPSISPPVSYSKGGNEFIIFNEYPNLSAPPGETTQNLIAMNLSTGEIVWKINDMTDFLASNTLHPPIIYKNKIITGGDWSIYAFDINTGEKLWRYEFDYPSAIWHRTNHLIYEDRLYVNNSQEDVTCLNLETGALIWNNPKGGPGTTNNMVYYEKENLLVFTSWGYGSVMILDALTGETLHREHRYDDSQYNNDVVYDKELDMFFTSTFKHAIGFKINKPK